MDEHILSEIESRRIEFKTNIHVFTQKHSLINKCHDSEDPHRWFQVNISAFACEQSLSYNAFNSPIWKVIADKLPVGNRTLTHFNVRKHYVEHYLTTKNMIMGSIREAKQVYTIPFLSVSLDLIQNAVQNKKLIGVRVSYIRGQDMKSWNLAVRGYNPTEQEVREGKASALLINWLGYIMREYDIDPEVHVLTSCTDSGSDVKRALEVELPTHREWCVSHLIHLALGDAVTVCCSAFCLLFCCHVRVCVSLTYTD
jgi:hypothetical protein